MRPLAHRVASHQIRIVRVLNDSHIFVRQALPLLLDAAKVHAESKHQKDRRYFVPAKGSVKFAERTDKELKGIYDHFIHTGLYRSLLVTAVSEFETFLVRVLTEVIREYPGKLTKGVTGISGCKAVPMDYLLDAADLSEVLDRAIAEHISGVFYAAPKAYLDYIREICGADTTDDAFQNYIEVKATRDLIVHNSGYINSVYMSKAGERARGELGTFIQVDSDYFDHALATLKRAAGVIKRDAEKTFQPRK
jgi:hypothetical protein